MPKKIPTTPKQSLIYVILGWRLNQGDYKLGIYGMSDRSAKDAWDSYHNDCNEDDLIEDALIADLPALPIMLTLAINTDTIPSPELLKGLMSPEAPLLVKESKEHMSKYHDARQKLQDTMVLSLDMSLSKPLKKAPAKAPAKKKTAPKKS